MALANAHHHHFTALHNIPHTWKDDSALTCLDRVEASKADKREARVYLRTRLAGADQHDANETVRLLGDIASPSPANRRHIKARGDVVL